MKELILMALVALSSSGSWQEKGWRGIVPLHSTRTDVEKVLGSAKESRGVASTFQAKDGRVRVFYSSGFCKNGAANDWNVPPDTVVSLTFEPNYDLMVADLKLEKNKYERVPDPHLQSGVYYFNKEEGIRISARTLGGGEVVQSITYEPAAKDYKLRCPKGMKQPPDANEQVYLELGRPPTPQVLSEGATTTNPFPQLDSARLFDRSIRGSASENGKPTSGQFVQSVETGAAN